MDYNATRRFIKARNPWLYRVSPGRRARLRGVMLHATRGGRSAGDDGPGTEGWAANPNNGRPGEGGGFWDWLAYESGQQVECTKDDEEPLWAAGYGGDNTWSAQDYYLQFELAQGRPEDPYPAEQIESAAQWVGELFKERGWPVQRIAYLQQVGTPPYGICTHEDSANGRRLGKSDPGYMFPWDTFLARARIWAGQATQEDEEMSAKDIARLDRLERVMGGHGINVTATADNLAVLKEAAGDNSLTIGRFVPLQGEGAMLFLDKMGMSLYGGLAINQQAIARLTELVQAISPVGGGLTDDALADALRRLADKLSGREGLASPPALLLPPGD